MTEKNCDSQIKDLSKKGAKNIGTLEELISRALDNCSLNAVEGREILKRLKAGKDVISDETKQKLLEVAKDGGWNAIAYRLDSTYRRPKTLPQEISPQTDSKELQDTTLDTKKSLLYLYSYISASISQIEKSKTWDSISFANVEEKNLYLQVLKQLLDVCKILDGKQTLQVKDIENAINTELSTSEGGVNFNRVRQKVKQEILSGFFSGNDFMFGFKQKAVKSIRENLGSDELKALFLKEFGQPYSPNMEVSKDKKWLLDEYKNAFNPDGNLTRMSDETSNSIKGFVAYDVTSTIASGVGAGLVVKGGAKATMGALKGVSVLNNGSKTVSVATSGVKALSTGVTFTALHEGIRNQEWFLNQKDVDQKIITNSLMFGVMPFAQQLGVGSFKYLESFKSKSPVVDGLLRQGLLAPAIFTGGLLSYDLLTQDEKKDFGYWLNTFILTGITSGAFHLTGAGVNKAISGLGVKATINEQTGNIIIQSPKNQEITLINFTPKKTKIADEVEGLYSNKKTDSSLPILKSKDYIREVPQTKIPKERYELSREQIKGLLQQDRVDLGTKLGERFQGIIIQRLEGNNYQLTTNAGTTEIVGKDNLIKYIQESIKTGKLFERPVPDLKLVEATPAKSQTPETPKQPEIKVSAISVETQKTGNILLTRFGNTTPVIRNEGKELFFDGGMNNSSIIILYGSRGQVTSINVVLANGVSGKYPFNGNDFRGNVSGKNIEGIDDKVLKEFIEFANRFRNQNLEKAA